MAFEESFSNLTPQQATDVLNAFLSFGSKACDELAPRLRSGGIDLNYRLESIPAVVAWLALLRADPATDELTTPLSNPVLASYGLRQFRSLWHIIWANALYEHFHICIGIQASEI